MRRQRTTSGSGRASWCGRRGFGRGGDVSPSGKGEVDGLDLEGDEDRFISAGGRHAGKAAGCVFQRAFDRERGVPDRRWQLQGGWLTAE